MSLLQMQDLISNSCSQKVSKLEAYLSKNLMLLSLQNRKGNMQTCADVRCVLFPVPAETRRFQGADIFIKKSHATVSLKVKGKQTICAAVWGVLFRFLQRQGVSKEQTYLSRIQCHCSFKSKREMDLCRCMGSDFRFLHRQGVSKQEYLLKNLMPLSF